MTDAKKQAHGENGECVLLGCWRGRFHLAGRPIRDVVSAPVVARSDNRAVGPQRNDLGVEEAIHSDGNDVMRMEAPQD